MNNKLVGELFFVMDWINTFEFVLISKFCIPVVIANSRPFLRAINSAWLLEEQWNPWEKPSSQFPSESLMMPPSPPCLVELENAPSMFSFM